MLRCCWLVDLPSKHKRQNNGVAPVEHVSAIIGYKLTTTYYVEPYAVGILSQWTSELLNQRISQLLNQRNTEPAIEPIITLWLMYFSMTYSQCVVHEEPTDLVFSAIPFSYHHCNVAELPACPHFARGYLRIYTHMNTTLHLNHILCHCI